MCARIRTIKPTHWSDKELANISLGAHLFWIASWNFSDDKGAFEFDPILLKSQIFPRRTDIKSEDIIEWCKELALAKFIIPLEYKKVAYFVTRTFEDHQRIDKSQPSKIPYELIVSVIKENSLINTDHSENDMRTLSSVLYSKVEESNSNGVESIAASPPSFKKMTEKDFYDSISVFVNDYSKEMLRAFYNYWSEKNEKNKMKFQLQKTWELKKRLITWNSKTFNNGSGTHKQSFTNGNGQKGTSEARIEKAKEW